MEKQLADVKHDFIRYANCWEDADILLEGLQITSGSRALSIGSAGDNSLSLLVDDPEIVVIVDVNQVQLDLIRLKCAAIRDLEYEDFLGFMGFKKCDRRTELFGKLRLSGELTKFWLSHIEDIEAGIIYRGKFERYFRYFRKKVLPWIHGQKRIDRLFEVKSGTEQAQFYDKKWSNLRWRFLFEIFFSKTIMAKFGRDPAFIKEVEGSFSKFILKQSRRHLSSTECQSNYYLHFILKGWFGDYLPHYAREENFKLIKQRLDRVELVTGFAEDAFKKYSGFDRFNLSNIYEYMDPALFKGVAHQMIDNGQKGARYGYWNLMVPRFMSKASDKVLCDTQISEELRQKDKGFFYSRVLFDEKR